MKTNRKVAIGFVVYKAEPTLLERLRVALELGFSIYIFDNSPEREVVREAVREMWNVRYFACGKNLGLGLGISSVCAQAYYDGYAALMFFDQDTCYTKATLEYVEKYFLDHPKLELKYSAVTFKANFNGVAEDLSIVDVTLAINSGSLFFLSNLKTMGWHNENYFVDCVDYEFSLRSMKYGFRIGVHANTPGFDHVTEQADREYGFLGMRCRMRAYSRARIFDSIRASIKLICAGFVSGEFRFSLVIMRLFFIYLVSQLIVRLLKPVERKVER